MNPLAKAHAPSNRAAREPVRFALLDANGPTGTFSNEDARCPGDDAQIRSSNRGWFAPIQKLRLIVAIKLA